MVKVRNGRNNKKEERKKEVVQEEVIEVEEDMYDAAWTMYGWHGVVFRSLEPPSRFKNYRRRRTIGEQRSSGSTSSYIVNQQSPLVNEESPLVNEEESPPPRPNDDNNNINNENNNVVASSSAAHGGGVPGRMVSPVLVDVMGACSPPLVKQLTKSDVADGQGRLTLGKEFVNAHLVPMFNAHEDLIVGIDVTAFDAEGRQYDMTFKLWASKLYVLMRGWKEFYKANDLTRAGEYVTVWMFRHVVTHKLCFAITQGRAGLDGP